MLLSNITVRLNRPKSSLLKLGANLADGFSLRGRSRQAHQQGVRKLVAYGKMVSTPAAEMGIEVTTGHCVTAVSMLETYLKAVSELGLESRSGRMVVIGLGSVGSAFVQLLLQQSVLPESLILIDTPSRGEHLQSFAQTITGKIPVSWEQTGSDGQLPANSACYNSAYLVTAVSTPNVVDVLKVAPGTVLVDDSQPNCWNRDNAWKRCSERHDIAPCEAGLVDCASIGYRSGFPFDFAGTDTLGFSGTSWSCLAEGLLKFLQPQLPATIGEPSSESLSLYYEAFARWKFGTAALQCGPRELPISELRRVVGKEMRR